MIGSGRETERREREREREKVRRFGVRKGWVIDRKRERERAEVKDRIWERWIKKGED